MSIRNDALAGKKTRLLRACAKNESITVEALVAGVAEGTIAVPRNVHHDFPGVMAIGKGTRTKVNANIGSSKDISNLDEELEKLKTAVDAGTDTVMDLSMGGDLDTVRRGILAQCPVPLGTVPIYQAVAETVDRQGRDLVDVTVDHIFKTIEKQAMDGVDFMTIHCGITKDLQERLLRQKRVMGVVSRGGSFLLEWMSHHKKENPLYEHFDDLLAILKEHEVTLSLGDGIRPGCLADATDRSQVRELIHLGELTERAWAAGVQVIIEGPGHMPMNQIAANVLLQKKMCKGAPFYVLGPLVTDIAPGYDHITGAIGGAIAAAAGADYLCYVTPAEHLKLPSVEDVHEGVIASRIAAHAADIAKELPGAIDRDNRMAVKRNRLDWKGQIDLSIDPAKAARFREEGLSDKGPTCSMCGSYCAIQVFNRSQHNLEKELDNGGCNRSSR
ncbi:MAG: phosphomethylpyrimidine synthase ThiC [Desulfobulbaceae bacterium]|jgi:phosphomethylpyrimidine synthase|nr:phosphomethylpyrimidine synthase ThiC [Desulfobulbaceae bacterium]MDY0351907.1 phosphomethylpyrimidine synthase ThiC [Desulfobulbaceae bacterium]